jgi:hypothetical protein
MHMIACILLLLACSRSKSIKGLGFSTAYDRLHTTTTHGEKAIALVDQAALASTVIRMCCCYTWLQL